MYFLRIKHNLILCWRNYHETQEYKITVWHWTFWQKFALRQRLCTRSHTFLPSKIELLQSLIASSILSDSCNVAKRFAWQQFKNQLIFENQNQMNILFQQDDFDSSSFLDLILFPFPLFLLWHFRFCTMSCRMLDNTLRYLTSSLFSHFHWYQKNKRSIIFFDHFPWYQKNKRRSFGVSKVDLNYPLPWITTRKLNRKKLLWKYQRQPLRSSQNNSKTLTSEGEEHDTHPSCRSIIWFNGQQFRFFQKVPKEKLFRAKSTYFPSRICQLKILL